MGMRESYAAGIPCWVNLATTDIEDAKAFYGAVFGWTEVREAPEIDYAFFEVGGVTVAGLQAVQEGAPPAWATYVAVEDVDAAVVRATELGAGVVEAGLDIPGHGRMAVLTDPGGAYILLWQAREFPGAALVNAHGAWAWGDLQTTEPDAAFAFYRELFGWAFTPVEASHGLYTTITADGRGIGGVMRNEHAPQPFWTTYFAVPSVASALTTIEAEGGRKIAGPIPVPSGSFALATDRQGAVFGVLDGDLDD
jgi:predicted enzyme related to lactoylglutathione lyase